MPVDEAVAVLPTAVAYVPEAVAVLPRAVAKVDEAFELYPKPNPSTETSGSIPVAKAFRKYGISPPTLLICSSV